MTPDHDLFLCRAILQMLLAGQIEQAGLLTDVMAGSVTTPATDDADLTADDVPSFDLSTAADALDVSDAGEQEDNAQPRQELPAGAQIVFNRNDDGRIVSAMSLTENSAGETVTVDAVFQRDQFGIASAAVSKDVNGVVTRLRAVFHRSADTGRITHASLV